VIDANDYRVEFNQNYPLNAYYNLVTELNLNFTRDNYANGWDAWGISKLESVSMNDRLLKAESMNISEYLRTVDSN